MQSRAQEQRYSRNMLDPNKRVETTPAADQSESCLTLKSSKSLQSPLREFGKVTSKSGSHTSCTAEAWEAPSPMEESKGCSTTAPSSVRPSESLNIKSEHLTQFSHCDPSRTTSKEISEHAKDTVDLDHYNSRPDGEDEGFCFNTECRDLYFTTGIEI